MDGGGWSDFLRIGGIDGKEREKKKREIVDLDDETTGFFLNMHESGRFSW